MKLNYSIAPSRQEKARRSGPFRGEGSGNAALRSIRNLMVVVVVVVILADLVLDADAGAEVWRAGTGSDFHIADQRIRPDTLAWVT